MEYIINLILLSLGVLISVIYNEIIKMNDPEYNDNWKKANIIKYKN